MKKILELKDVTKIFKVYNSNINRLKELFLKKTFHKEFISNKNISFELYEGETLGIIGVNGAGKSTILKQIAGVISPTSGTIVRHGRVTALLELGTGFNYELSGYENIYLNGILIGMTNNEIDSNIDNIISFSELGEYINEPVKSYSSGMTMRLAFSIALFSKPEVLIVDEALSVGDAHFSAKCTKALKERKKENMSIIYVSHDLNSLKLLCDRVILLNNGEIIKEGNPSEVINMYNFLIAKLNDEQNLIKTSEESSFGKLDVEIIKAEIIGVDSKSNLISSGEDAIINIYIYSNVDLEDMTVGIIIRDKFGQDIYGTNSHYLNTKISFKEGENYFCSFYLPLNIGTGKYSLTVAVHSDENHLEHCSHWFDNILEFEIAGIKGNFFVGLCNLNTNMDFRKI